MSLTRVKTWTAGEVLTANDLNNEFNNITDNVLAEPIVLTQNIDINAKTIILDDDGNTSIDATVNDTIDVTIAGADDFRLTANTFTALSGSSIAVVSGNITIDAGNLTATSGNLTVTDGNTTLANPDARTNTVATPLTVSAETSGTPVAGIGTGMVFTAESADEAPSNFGQIEFAATDVTAGSEDTYFQVLTRVAGATLTAVYRFVATGAFKGIFTHANTADRTYTLPNYDGTLATVAGTETFTNKTFNAQDTGNSLTNVSTSALKTSTGSASGVNTAALNITMNDYAFFPSLFGKSNAPDNGNSAMVAGNYQDASDTVGRFTLNANGAGTGTNHGARWRYVTASDSPVIWVASDPATGDIRAAWTSDDPTPGDVPGVEVSGCVSMKFTALDLQAIPAIQPFMPKAATMIQAKNWRMTHQAYRALQLLANDNAPSSWILTHCQVNPVTKRLRARA